MFASKYNSKLVLVPGKDQVYVIGGSNDVQCQQVSNEMVLVKSDGTIKNCKPMISQRCKTGACVGMLTSEANTQFSKTYLCVFGGIDHSNSVIKSVEKYNIRANIW